jgi:hypothetical protein
LARSVTQVRCQWMMRSPRSRPTCCGAFWNEAAIATRGKPGAGGTCVSFHSPGRIGLATKRRPATKRPVLQRNTRAAIRLWLCCRGPCWPPSQGLVGASAVALPLLIFSLSQSGLLPFGQTRGLSAALRGNHSCPQRQRQPSNRTIPILSLPVFTAKFRDHVRSRASTAMVNEV